MKKTLRILSWNILILFILLLVVELVLYFKGYEPGMVDNNPWFEQVDDLKVLDGFTTDSLGIQKIAANTRDFVAQQIKAKDNSDACKHLSKEDYYTPIYNIAKDFVDVHLGKHQNAFYHYMKNETDSILLDYFHAPINADGFKSIAFKNHQSSKKKVLLLGDSFTFGHTTDNKTDSFADILLTKNHLVYNSGITSTDIPQYEAIAKHYVAIIQPDIVIANIFLGNDITQHDRKVSKDFPIFYSTNAGFINSGSTGIPFPSADSIYNHMIRLSSIPQTSIFNSLMSKTRTTTLAWAVLAKLRIFGIGPWPTQYSGDFWNKVQRIWDETGYAINREYLESIDSICQANNAIFIPSIIPEDSHFNIPRKEVDVLLDGFEDYYLINNLERDDYTASDGHFNEKGHLKYAEYLDEIIK